MDPSVSRWCAEQGGEGNAGIGQRGGASEHQLDVAHHRFGLGKDPAVHLLQEPAGSGDAVGDEERGVDVTAACGHEPRIAETDPVTKA